MNVNGLQSEILRCSKKQIFLVETDNNHSSFGDMETQSPPELVDQTKRELAEVRFSMRPGNIFVVREVLDTTLLKRTSHVARIATV
jgi:hypothetical protein